MKLNYLSKKFGIDLNYFLPQGILVAGRFVVTTLITLLISVAFARLTSKETFGQYQYVLSIASLLSIFSLPGLNTAALRAFVEGDEHAIQRSVRYSFLGSLIASLILVVFGLYDSIHGQRMLGMAIALSGVFMPFFYAPNNWYLYYEGKLNFRSSTLRLIAANLILLIGILIGLKNGFNLVGLVLLYFGLNATLTVYFYLEGKKKVTSPVTISKLNINYAIRCTIQKFTGTLGENIQSVAVSTLFGFANLAIYQVAQSFVNAFVGLTGALSATYFPLLVKYKRFNHTLIVIQHIIIGIIFWLGYLVAVRFLFTPLYGIKYHESIELAHRLSFIVIVLPLRVYLCNFLSVQDRNQFVIGTNLVASAIALSLFYVVKNQGFFPAAILYLYSLNLLMVLPLLGFYLFSTAKSQRQVNG